jgi:hypothetical protein
MSNDEHVAMLGRGAVVWNAWRTEQDEIPDLSRAGLRGLDAGSIFPALIFGAPILGGRTCATRISRAHIWTANLFKAVLDGADLARAFLEGAQFLNCAQLVVARNWRARLWRSYSRPEALGIGVSRL